MNLLLKHFFDLPDLFFNFAGVIFGHASDSKPGLFVTLPAFSLTLPFTS